MTSAVSGTKSNRKDRGLPAELCGYTHQSFHTSTSALFKPLCPNYFFPGKNVQDKQKLTKTEQEGCLPIHPVTSLTVGEDQQGGGPSPAPDMMQKI
jgi:hypothetical protein